MSYINEQNKFKTNLEDYVEQTTPDIPLTLNTKKRFNEIIDACKKSGLDGFEYIYEFFNWDEISELAAYGGFPVRYPHYMFGMEFEHMNQSYKYGYSKIYEMVTNNCIDGNQRVPTPEGLIQLQDLDEFGNVYYDGNIYNRTQVYPKGKKKTLKITIDDGRTIKVTPDHELVLWNGEDVEAQRLQVGSFIRTKKNNSYNIGSTLDFSNHTPFTRSSEKGGHNYHRINLPQESSEELAELIGILCGDGTYNDRGGRIEISFGLKSEVYMNYVIKLIRNIFDYEPKVKTHSNGRQVQIFSKQIRHFLFDCIGLDYETEYNKKVPESIFRMSSSERRAFVRGLLDTDGHVNKSVISFSNISEELLRGTQTVLLYENIRSRLSRVENEYNEIYLLSIVDLDSKRIFVSRINPSSYKDENLINILSSSKKSSPGWSKVPNELVESINDKLNKRSLNGHSFIRSDKQYNLLNQLNKALLHESNSNLDFNNELDLLNNYWFAEIVSIEDGGEIDVYDIEVSEAEHFEANGLMVHNSPCYAYLLNSNNEVDNETVIAHAYAHNDFFKHNKWFEHSNRNMMNEMAAHGTKIRRYCTKYGRDKVIQFLDLALSIQFLIEPDDVFKEQNEYENYKFDDDVISDEPRRTKIAEDQHYMEDFLNPKEFIESERQRIQKEYNDKIKKFPLEPTRDVLGFLGKNSQVLRNWMRDILFILRKESLYFVPQIKTKIINEGWASYWDEEIMVNQGFAGDAGIIDYAKHHSGVLGGKYSRNPYKVGNMLLKYVEEKWNKGRFGTEWENCNNVEEKRNWDKKLNLGREKLFEVRKYYDDYMLIDEFMDQDFCDTYEFYTYEKNDKNEYVIVSKEVNDIKRELLRSVGMERFPIIKVKNANLLNMGHLHLEHTWTGRTIHFGYAKDVVCNISKLWGKPVALSTFEVDSDYDQNIPMKYNSGIVPAVVYSLDGKKATIGTWSDYKQEFLKAKSTKDE